MTDTWPDADSLLRKALFRLLAIRPQERPLRHLSDRVGEYAVVTASFVLTAKKYAWTEDKIVSCHLDAAKAAANDQRQLLMFIESEDSFFEFSPGKIMLNGTENLRGQSIMLNFPITLATSQMVAHPPAARRPWDG